MEEESKVIEISLKDFWNVFKQCWIVVTIAVIVVAIGLYIGLTVTHEDEYTASVHFYILRNSTDDEGNQKDIGTGDISIANALINDCKVLMVSPDNVLKPVLSEMPSLVDTNWKDLNKMVSVSGQSENRILTLSVTTTDPETSAEIANKIASHAQSYVNDDLYKQPIANIVDYAEVPTVPSNPVSKLMVLLIAFVAGVAVYAIYFVVFMLDDKINSAEDVERYLGVSMLGMIPNRYDVARRKGRYGSKYGYYYAHDDGKTPDKK